MCYSFAAWVDFLFFAALVAFIPPSHAPIPASLSLSFPVPCHSLSLFLPGPLFLYFESFNVMNHLPLPHDCTPLLLLI